MAKPLNLDYESQKYNQTHRHTRARTHTHIYVLISQILIQAGSGLSLQQLETLVKMEPTKEEETKLKSYKGDINELGSAEKFVMAIMKIPFAFLRIEAMLYKETFEDEVLLLKKSFSMLEVTYCMIKSQLLSISTIICLTQKVSIHNYVSVVGLVNS